MTNATPIAATAKIFMHGRSQVVHLPKEFGLRGKEVRITKVGDKVILEPLKKAPFDVVAWRAQLVAAGARAFLPQGLRKTSRLRRLRRSKLGGALQANHLHSLGETSFAEVPDPHPADFVGHLLPKGEGTHRARLSWKKS
jgi:antitoxin VapB